MIIKTYQSPLEIFDLLNEFENIFPKELPNVLPPMREIQHTIDLIPRAS